MNSTSRVAGAITLVLALLVGLGALTVSAQGPTTTPTPAQAPPAAASGTFKDDPGTANTLGNSVGSIPANSAAWFRFDYDTAGNQIPRPLVTVRMFNGVQNGLNYEIWSPERMQPNWFDNVPVGRGTQEVIPDCTVTLPDNTITRCTTSDLTWVGGFGAPGTYYIRVVNNTNNAVAPAIIVSGPGLAQCQTANGLPAQGQVQGSGQGFTIAQCTDPTADQLQSLSQQVTSGQGNTTAPAAAPSPAATEAPAATTAPTTAATSAPGAAATTTVSPTMAATSTPAAAPSVSATETTAPSTGATSSATDTPAAPSSAAGSTPSASGTSPAASAAGLAVGQTATLGSFLTDSQGRTLYVFSKDTSNTSTCTGNCAQTWPPFTSQGTSQGGSGVTASMIGTSARSDGSTQVTYNGHPLYYYSGDKNMGDTNGQGIGGNWFVISPSGDPVQASAPGGAATSAPSSGGGNAPTPSASPTP
jgi:predicted lipoprotein with Yx(FWY)xxD motif